MFILEFYLLEMDLLMLWTFTKTYLISKLFIFIYREIKFPDGHNSSDINKFLTIMLDKNINNRFSEFEIISSHCVFEAINWDELIKYQVKPQFIPKDLRDWSNNLENLSNPIEIALKVTKVFLKY